MIETLMHALGLCPDAHCHLNLMNLIVGGLAGSWAAFGFWVRVKIGRVVAGRAAKRSS